MCGRLSCLVYCMLHFSVSAGLTMELIESKHKWVFEVTIVTPTAPNTLKLVHLPHLTSSLFPIPIHLVYFSPVSMILSMSSLPPSLPSLPPFQCATLPLQALLALPGGAVCISGCSSKPGPQQHCSKFTHNHSIAQNRACYAHAYVCTYVANRSYWLCSLTCPTFQSVFVQYIRTYVLCNWVSLSETRRRLQRRLSLIINQSRLYVYTYVYVRICTIRFTIYFYLCIQKLAAVHKSFEFLP